MVGQGILLEGRPAAAIIGRTALVYEQASKIEFMTRINTCPVARGPHGGS